MKLIPNKHVQELFGRPEFEGLDGELIVGPWNDPHVYNTTVSGVMKIEGEPDVQFAVFDVISDDPYEIRLVTVDERVYELEQKFGGCVGMVGYRLCNNIQEVHDVETMWVEMGFEGVMLRDPQGGYKHGRSTEKQGWLMKLKQFKDIEAEIVGYKELMHNENEAEINELGRTQRSTKKEGKVPAGVLGAFVCKAEGYADTFDVGTGFTAEMRQQYWNKRAALIGQLVKIKIQPSGELNKPRFPVFLGFRDKRDLS